MIAGGCQCGAVRYEGTAKMGFSYLCYCRSCQQTTGTGHAANFFYDKDNLTLSGELLPWKRVGASGQPVTTYRCKICRSLVIARPDTAAAGKLSIPAGTLDDPSQFRPKKLLFTEEAQPWDMIPELEETSS